MVDDAKIPPGPAIGQLPDGSINIGTPEQMRKRQQLSEIESNAAEKAVSEAFSPEPGFDLDDVDDNGDPV